MQKISKTAKEIQKKILLSAKKSFTQTVVEIRNIALEITLQVKYRSEMLIKLIELSLDNFEHCQKKFKNNITSEGFGSYLDLKSFLDTSLIKFNHDAQILISNFTKSTTDKCFSYIIPNKKSRKVKKFLREWTKMDLTIAELLRRLNDCDDRIIKKTQSMQEEFSSLLKECNIKPVQINGAFDFLMENLENLERKNYEMYDPEKEEGFEELMLVFQKCFERRDEIREKDPSQHDQKLKEEVEFLGKHVKYLDDKGDRLRDEMKFEIGENKRKIEIDKIEGENLDFFKKRKKKKNVKKKKKKEEDVTKKPISEVSDSVLISINKTHFSKNDSQFSSQSNSLKIKKNEIDEEFGKNYLFDFLTSKDLVRAKKEPISFKKFFKLRTLNLNNNIVGKSIIFIIFF